MTPTIGRDRLGRIHRGVTYCRRCHTLTWEVRDSNGRDVCSDCGLPTGLGVS